MRKIKSWKVSVTMVFVLLSLNVMYAVKSLMGIDLDKRGHHGNLFPIGKWIYKEFRHHPVPLSFSGQYFPVNHDGYVGRVSGVVSDGWWDNSAFADITILYKKIPLNGSPAAFAQGVEVSQIGPRSACQLVQSVTVKPGHTYLARALVRSKNGIKIQLLLRQPQLPYRVICASECQLGPSWTEITSTGTPRETDVDEDTVLFMLHTDEVGSFEVAKASLSEVSAKSSNGRTGSTGADAK